jgi:SAM-dependent methyltransferase
MQKMKRGNGDELKKRMPQPLIERQSKQKIEKLFRTTIEFSKEKREHHEEILAQERRIFKEYEAFSPEERVLFFSILYDDFAEKYDKHMGVETKHFQAIKEVLRYAGQFIRFPLLDITAGTGEPLKYIIELMEARKTFSSMEGVPSIAVENLPPCNDDLIVANEISLKMLENAKEKLVGVEFTSDNAYELAWERKFNTVLCTQTFHLIPEDDKARLVKSINRALVSGGIAIIVEEDPFRISPTPSIEAVEIFIRAVSCPIKDPNYLVGSFEVNGFTKLEQRAVWPIDQWHTMRLHLFQKTKDV